MKKFSKIVVLLFVILLVSSGCKSSAIEPVSETTTVNAVSNLDLTFYKNGRDELIEAQASGCKWRNFSKWGLKEISSFQWIDYNGEIASATAIRSLIQRNRISDVKTYLTPASYSILVDEMQKGHFITSITPFEQTIIYNLRNMPVEKILNLPDVSEGLEYLIKKAANSCNSINEFINIVSSKRYTESRIRRILLYSLLKITKRDIAISKKVNPYIRVLGFNENGKNLISKIKRSNPRLNIITSVKRFENFNVNKNLGIMLSKDIFATNVYTLGYMQDSWSNLDYTKKVITL